MGYESLLNTIFSEAKHRIDRLHAYQMQAKDFLIENPYSALFIDCGMGKTVIALTAIAELISDYDGVAPVLLIAPTRVANETWPTEIREWFHTAWLSFMHIRNDNLMRTLDRQYQAKVKLHVAQTGREITPIEREEIRLRISRELVMAQHKRNPHTKIHIITREMIPWLVDIWRGKWPYKTVLIDESSAFKSHNSERFKMLRKVRPLIKRMHQFTATPAGEGYMDLFAQIYLLDEGQRLGNKIGVYEKLYFDRNRYNFELTLKEGAEEKISKKISDICLVMKAEDHLKIERPIFIQDRFKLPGDLMEKYTRLEQDYVIELDNGTIIEAETAGAVSQKKTQFVSGVIYEKRISLDEYGEAKAERIIHALHNHKIEKCAEVVEAANEPVVIVYVLNSSLAQLKKQFPQAVVMDKQGAAVKKWNAGKIPILLLHPQSDGFGLNIQYGGRRGIFFDTPWSFEQFYQTWRRLARQGQTRTVFWHLLTATGTVDEKIFEALTDKDMTQDKFFKLLKKYQTRGI